MDEGKTIHDCLDCDGCLLEELCDEYDRLDSGFLTEDEE